MAIKFNQNEVKDVKYNGVDVNFLQFNGVEIWKRSAYQPDEVVFESSTSGNYSLDILSTGRYEIAVVGGGGGGNSQNLWAISGGSGSCFVGEVLISKGNYNLQIGAGGQRGQNGSNTSIENICTAYGGNFGTARGGGAGGAIPTIYTTIYTSSINSEGKRVGMQANVNAGSLYNGYGAGTTTNGTNGYIRIIYKGT